MKVAVAVSGGLDSLASLVMLKEEGHEVLALHARFFSHQGDHLEQRLGDICAGLGLDLHVWHLQDEFASRVIRPFVQDYLGGVTPNPCAHCNRRIKFGLLLDRAVQLGASALATGHYAHLENRKSGPMLKRPLDRDKDQSYFLCLVPPKKLARAVLPMRGQYKSRMRSFLQARRITVPTMDESNEICFIPGDYREFISDRINMDQKPAPGPIVDSSGRTLGQHQGLWRYTPGQRRGLGIAFKHPLYVLRKDLSTNTLVVGPREELGVLEFEAGRLNILADPLNWPRDLLIQTRYRQKARPAEIELHQDRMWVRYKDEPGLPVSGQVAAVYSPDGQVLAGGIIKQV
ncbi:tRNA 2-thiouridine(34) synthase MnmA [Desulfonatronospira sp.]|uniref:tRNA 2-thiouridine(34) synthase MnmA n=1 Tax=Desulfonatronospira sp. TaxID=1962951 RepID=UPI0025C5C8B0|nr:tRNA 2-thiouridine(34) synthase MnmA [Desulfonatronospira sp.]